MAMCNGASLKENTDPLPWQMELYTYTIIILLFIKKYGPHSRPKKYGHYSYHCLLHSPELIREVMIKFICHSLGAMVKAPPL